MCEQPAVRAVEFESRKVNQSHECDGDPLPDKILEFWFVERYQPGYDSFGKADLSERMATGGRQLRVRTDAQGRARVVLSHLDAIADEHHSVQFVARFNAEGGDLDYRPYQTCQFGFYSAASQERSNLGGALGGEQR